MFRPTNPSFCASSSVLLFLGCVFAYSPNHQRLGSLTVDSKVGLITGTKELVKLYGNDYEVNVYRGIPYAESPTGPGRFKRPVRRARFEDGFNATEYGAGCYQAWQSKWYGLISFFPESEDCLKLNIYAPAAANVTNRRPVMVWIHGGGWVIGAGQRYNGIPLAAFGDIVIVTLNYRLGAFGFLSTEDDNAPGNNGLFDQLLALEWVNDNIAEFGGDPKVVTIFGESAGGVDATLHAISPRSVGKLLFTRCIAHSGAAIFPYPKSWMTVRNPQTKAQALAELVGCPKTPADEMITCLQLTSPDVLQRESNSVGRVVGDSAWGPIIDGDFITRPPMDLFTDPSLAAPGFQNISLMVGSNSADGDTNAWRLPSPMRNDLLAEQIGRHLQDVPNANDIIRAVLHEYPPRDSTDEEARNTMIDIFSDSMFIGPSIATAQTHERSSPAAKSFMYFFDYANNPITSSKHRPGKAGHFVELVYIFFFPWAEMSQLPNQTLQVNITEDDRQLSRAMMTYWTNFAKYGDPNGDTSDPTNATTRTYTEWPEFSQNDQQYLEFGSNGTDIKLTKKKDLRSKKTAFWLDYVPYLLKKTSCHKQDVETTTRTDNYVPCTECPELRDQSTGYLDLTVNQAFVACWLLFMSSAFFLCLSFVFLIVLVVVKETAKTLTGDIRC